MNIFFDILIFGFLVFDILIAIWFIKKKKPQLNRSKSFSFITLAFIAWGVIFYGSFIAPKRVSVDHQTINLSDSPKETITVAIISDLHVGPYKKEDYLQKVINKIIDQKPNLVFIAGDFVSDSIEEVGYLAPLKTLTQTIPTYAVLGNHDYDLSGADDEIDDELAQKIRTELNSLGVILMEDESRPLASGKLWITGSQEIWTNRNDLSSALKTRSNPELPSILLTHNPDIIEQLQPEDEVQLVIAGHTHGGQIRLPFLGPIGIIPNVLGQKYDQGFFDYNGVKLFITSGLGESGPRARLFNPPEIVMMEIGF